jgi:L-lactate utilization protein LutB
LVNLTTKNEELFAEVNDLKEVRNQMKEISGRYNTALELIGEKEEQVEELRADIADMKLLYKEQINELLEKVEEQKQNR